MNIPFEEYQRLWEQANKIHKKHNYRGGSLNWNKIMLGLMKEYKLIHANARKRSSK